MEYGYEVKQTGNPTQPENLQLARVLTRLNAKRRRANQDLVTDLVAYHQSVVDAEHKRLLAEDVENDAIDSEISKGLLVAPRELKEQIRELLKGLI